MTFSKHGFQNKYAYSAILQQKTPRVPDIYLLCRALCFIPPVRGSLLTHPGNSWAKIYLQVNFLVFLQFPGEMCGVVLVLSLLCVNDLGGSFKGKRNLQVL